MFYREHSAEIYGEYADFMVLRGMKHQKWNMASEQRTELHSRRHTPHLHGENCE